MRASFTDEVGLYGVSRLHLEAVVNTGRRLGTYPLRSVAYGLADQLRLAGLFDHSLGFWTRPHPDCPPQEGATPAKKLLLLASLVADQVEPRRRQEQVQ